MAMVGTLSVRRHKTNYPRGLVIQVNSEGKLASQMEMLAASSRYSQEDSVDFRIDRAWLLLGWCLLRLRLSGRRLRRL